MKIVALSGGVGGSRFLQGVLGLTGPTDDLTIVANTADDIWLFGLRVCPDLDTVMYTLGSGIDPDRGWGRTQETWHAVEELAAYGADQTWFGLGDRDLATHLLRSQMLRQGSTLADVTAELCQRWSDGTALGRTRLLPMTNDEVETHISTTVDGRDVVMHFQEFWIRHRAQVAVHGVELRGVDRARACPGVVEALRTADLVILPPSNPVVSIGPIVAVPEIGEALRTTPAPVVGVSPIIGGAAVRGMADQLMTGLGLTVSASAVAELHGARSRGGVLDGWLVDTSDADEVTTVEALGVTCRAVPLYMSDADSTERLAAATLELGREVGS